MTALPYVAGFAVAPAVAAFAWLAGFDRDGSFYPTVLIVTASYYALFAVLAGDPGGLVEEVPGFLLFAAAATIGYRITPWIVVTAFVGHGAFDVLHGEMIANPGTPPWWPAFCLSFDLAAAACLALRVRRRPLRVA